MLGGSIPSPTANLPAWWKSRHTELKIQRPSGHAGAIPVAGTNLPLWRNRRRVELKIRCSPERVGAIPTRGTTRGHVAQLQSEGLIILGLWVRVPLWPPFCLCSSIVEHLPCKQAVAGASPIGGSTFLFTISLSIVAYEFLLAFREAVKTKEKPTWQSSHHPRRPPVRSQAGPRSSTQQAEWDSPNPQISSSSASC